MKSNISTSYPYYKLTNLEKYITSKKFLAKEDLNMLKYRNEYSGKYKQY